MTRFYAGIGSRKTPPAVLSDMRRIGRFLACAGWTLRSGGAAGADKAFEGGCDLSCGSKEVFFATESLPPWAFAEAEKHIPSNRPPFSAWKPYTRNIIARNMMQVLGRDGLTPVRFVACWTQADVKEGGGTGYAMRCAVHHDIPVFNLHDEQSGWEAYFEALIGEKP